MDTRAALHRAVLDNPDDDTPRLVLADHLDELGGGKNHARAELIRLQCGYYNRTGDLSRAQQDRVAAAVPRVDALLRKWGAGWLPSRARIDHAGAFGSVRGEVFSVPLVRDDRAVGEYRYTFERGFVSRVWAVQYRPDGRRHPPRLDPAATARTVANCLAANPVGHFRFEAEGFDPHVVIRIRDDGGWAASVWTETDDGDEMIGYTGVRPDRRALVRAVIEQLIPVHLPAVRFAERAIDIPF